MANIRKLESELWEAADLLRADSKVTSQEYCMPVLCLIFLRYAYSRFKFVEADILKDRSVRNGRVLPVEAADFKTKSAIFLPEEARYSYLLNLPDNAKVGEAINRAMELIEEQSTQLKGILPKNYTTLQDDLLRELLRIFNNSALNDIKDDIIGRIYEYFLNKFAPAVASDDGVFFTPKSLVRMIVNIIEPTHGTVLGPACGSGGMFVSSADFIEKFGATVVDKTLNEWSEWQMKNLNAIADVKIPRDNHFISRGHTSADLLNAVIMAFRRSNIYIDTALEQDVEIIRRNYFRWRQTRREVK